MSILPEGSNSKPDTLAPVGYIIAERHVYGPNAGKLDADWDGVIHRTRADADAELALANSADGCCDGSHWKLYELRKVSSDDKLDREVVALAWHDVICPESEACRDRRLHALSQTVFQFGFLQQFLARLAGDV